MSQLSYAPVATTFPSDVKLSHPLSNTSSVASLASRPLHVVQGIVPDIKDTSQKEPLYVSAVSLASTATTAVVPRSESGGQTRRLNTVMAVVDPIEYGQVSSLKHAGVPIDALPSTSKSSLKASTSKNSLKVASQTSLKTSSVSSHRKRPTTPLNSMESAKKIYEPNKSVTEDESPQPNLKEKIEALLQPKSSIPANKPKTKRVISAPPASISSNAHTKKSTKPYDPTSVRHYMDRQIRQRAASARASERSQAQHKAEIQARLAHLQELTEKQRQHVKRRSQTQSLVMFHDTTQKVVNLEETDLPRETAPVIRSAREALEKTQQKLRQMSPRQRVPSPIPSNTTSPIRSAREALKASTTDHQRIDQIMHELQKMNQLMASQMKHIKERKSQPSSAIAPLTESRAETPLPWQNLVKQLHDVATSATDLLAKTKGQEQALQTDQSNLLDAEVMTENVSIVTEVKIESGIEKNNYNIASKELAQSQTNDNETPVKVSKNSKSAKKVKQATPVHEETRTTSVNATSPIQQQENILSTLAQHLSAPFPTHGQPGDNPIIQLFTQRAMDALALKREAAVTEAAQRLIETAKQRTERKLKEETRKLLELERKERTESEILQKEIKQERESRPIMSLHYEQDRKASPVPLDSVDSESSVEQTALPLKTAIVETIIPNETMRLSPDSLSRQLANELLFLDSLDTAHTHLSRLESERAASSARHETLQYHHLLSLERSQTHTLTLSALASTTRQQLAQTSHQQSNSHQWQQLNQLMQELAQERERAKHLVDRLQILEREKALEETRTSPHKSYSLPSQQLLEERLLERQQHRVEQEKIIAFEYPHELETLEEIMAHGSEKPLESIELGDRKESHSRQEQDSHDLDSTLASVSDYFQDEFIPEMESEALEQGYENNETEMLEQEKPNESNHHSTITSSISEAIVSVVTAASEPASSVSEALKEESTSEPASTVSDKVEADTIYQDAINASEPASSVSESVMESVKAESLVESQPASTISEALSVNEKNFSPEPESSIQSDYNDSLRKPAELNYDDDFEADSSHSSSDPSSPQQGVASSAAVQEVHSSQHSLSIDSIVESIAESIGEMSVAESIAESIQEEDSTQIWQVLVPSPTLPDTDFLEKKVVSHFTDNVKEIPSLATIDSVQTSLDADGFEQVLLQVADQSEEERDKDSALLDQQVIVNKVEDEILETKDEREFIDENEMIEKEYENEEFETWSPEEKAETTAIDLKSIGWRPFDDEEKPLSEHGIITEDSHIVASSSSEALSALEQGLIAEKTEDSSDLSIQEDICVDEEENTVEDIATTIETPSLEQESVAVMVAAEKVHETVHRLLSSEWIPLNEETNELVSVQNDVQEPLVVDVPTDVWSALSPITAEMLPPDEEEEEQEVKESDDEECILANQLLNQASLPSFIDVDEKLLKAWIRPGTGLESSQPKDPLNENLFSMEKSLLQQQESTSSLPVSFPLLPAAPNAPLPVQYSFQRYSAYLNSVSFLNTASILVYPPPLPRNEQLFYEDLTRDLLADLMHAGISVTSESIRSVLLKLADPILKTTSTGSSSLERALSVQLTRELDAAEERLHRVTLRLKQQIADKLVKEIMDQVLSSIHKS